MLPRDFTEEQQMFRSAYRKFLEQEVAPNVDAWREQGIVDREVFKKAGEQGFLMVWPDEQYGGMGDRDFRFEQIIIEETANVYGGDWANTLHSRLVGPYIDRFGSEEQKARFLPRCVSGELILAVAMTEPDAGSDPAGMKTRAGEQGDHWVLNGAKTYISNGILGDLFVVAARTDPDTPGREGITIFAVDTRDPGFSIQPFETFGTTHTPPTFYDGVRVPDTMRIGEVNGGWGLITSQLNRERVSLFPAGRMARLVDDAVSWAGETRLADGRRAIDQERVKVILAECLALVRHLDLLNWWVAHENTNGRMNPADASSVKVHGSESMHRIYTRLTEAVGTPGNPDEGSPGADLAARIEVAYRSVWVLTFGGGTNEIQRDIIGAAGLGLPREQRRK